MAYARQTPVIDVLQRGDDILIRTEADIAPEDVRVAVHDGLLEIRVPRESLRMAPAPSRTEGRGGLRAGGETGGRQSKPPREEQPRARSHPSGTQGAEPPLGAADEQDFWDSQKTLISEDRVTSIHLEGFTDEQANEVMEVLGDDAPEEAQGGSATGADDFPAHGGFPSRNPQEDEQS